ncbi:MAG: META domain-containing protein [Stackebrandtia sp.]
MKRVAATVGVAGVFALAACGEGADGGGYGDDASDDSAAVSGDELAGKTFEVEEVTGDADSQALMGDVAFTATFAEDSVVFRANCNNVQGTITLDEGVMTASSVAMTEIACQEPEFVEQDEWLLAFLESSPTWELQDESTLAFADGDLTVVMTESAPPDMDESEAEPT